MKTAVVLAMHGAPPTDFPEAEMGELMEQHAQLDQAVGPDRGWFERRHAELQARVWAWSRSAENDPCHAAAHEWGEQLSRAIRRAQARHPDTPIVDLWGFDVSDIVSFLAGPIQRQLIQTSAAWEPAARATG